MFSMFRVYCLFLVSFFFLVLGAKLFGLSIDTPQSQYGKACPACHMAMKVTW